MARAAAGRDGDAWRRERTGVLLWRFAVKLDAPRRDAVVQSLRKARKVGPSALRGAADKADTRRRAGILSAFISVKAGLKITADRQKLLPGAFAQWVSRAIESCKRVWSFEIVMSLFPFAATSE